MTTTLARNLPTTASIIQREVMILSSAGDFVDETTKLRIDLHNKRNDIQQYLSAQITGETDAFEVPTLKLKWITRTPMWRGWRTIVSHSRTCDTQWKRPIKLEIIVATMQSKKMFTAVGRQSCRMKRLERRIFSSTWNYCSLFFLSLNRFYRFEFVAVFAFQNVFSSVWRRRLLTVNGLW